MSQGGNLRQGSGGGGSGITQINGDTGSTTGPIVTFTTNPGAGVVSSFDVSGATATLSISLTGSSGFTWQVINSDTPMLANNGYIVNSSSLVTLRLPTVASVGTLIEIAGKNTGGWTISQESGQSIIIGNQTTIVGVSGSLSSSMPTDCVRMVCTITNTEFEVLSQQGNPGVS